MRIRILLLLFLSSSYICQAQLSGVDFDVIDSLIATTPEISLCKINGKEDERFFTKTPEKYSNYKQEFMKLIADSIAFPTNNHFRCDITAEINCRGEAGNYDFAIEPKIFTPEDFKVFQQLIQLVNQNRNYVFKPAIYLNENVNSKVHFRLLSKDGKAVMQ